jgi:serine protease Do
MEPIMKPKLFTTTCIAVFMINPAFAIDTPADDSPAPAVGESTLKPAAEAPKANNALEKTAPNQKEDVAYLGVLATQVSDMLAGHLGLKEGEGIAVQMVAPDAPAAKAGITVNDIITRVGEKPVGSHTELSELVTGCKPGDTIRLEVIHKGKRAGLDVTLGTRPEGIDNLQPNPLIEGLPLDGVPKEMADRIRGAIKGNLGGIRWNFGNMGEDALTPENIQDMKNQMKKMGGLKGLGLDFQTSSCTRMMDDEGSVEMKSTQGGKEATLRDKDDKVTWTGPWDTEQDKAAAPEDVRNRINRLHLNDGGVGNGMLKIIPDLLNHNQNHNGKNAEDVGADEPK